MRTLMSARQAPAFKTEGTYFPKACPRITDEGDRCGGDVGRFPQVDGKDEYKCLSCSREVKRSALN